MHEIERKFLVKRESLIALEEYVSYSIVQAYLLNEEDRSLRLRIKGEKAFIAIKSGMSGITRSEFEYEVPVEDVMEMIEEFKLKTLCKTRYEIPYQGHVWEVDVFEEALDGLVLAEVELKNEDESFSKPDWIGEEVSTDPRYLNANLIHRL